MNACGIAGSKDVSDLACGWTPVSGLLAWEKAQADREFLHQPRADGERVYTWAQVADQSRRMASHLQSLGYPVGTRVAILSKNCAHWFMAELAIWMAGFVSVPIYPSLNSKTMKYILDHSESRLIFLGRVDDWASMAEGLDDGLPVVCLPDAPQISNPIRSREWESIVQCHAPATDLHAAQSEDLASVVYTSGTTGMPKGVMLSFRSFAISSTLFSHVMDVSSQERMISYLPLAHAFEAAVVFAASLRYGFKVFFNESIKTFTRDVKRARPTIFHSVPRLWVKFQQGVLAATSEEELNERLQNPSSAEYTRRAVLHSLGLDQVKVGLSGSAPLPTQLLQWYRGLGLELLEGYGMSEDFSYSHLSRPGATRIGYVGTPVNGVERRFDDNGELLIKSPSCMLGYYLEPEKTRDAFTADGFFKTGDLGSIDELGRLRITGRIKELFKTSKGKYVAPAPIENKLMVHQRVEVACVMGIGEPQPIGLLMLNPEFRSVMDPAYVECLKEEFSGLMSDVNSALDPHEQLSKLVVVKDQWSIANGFLTPTMKIRRNVVEERYARFVEGWSACSESVIWQ